MRREWTDREVKYLNNRYLKQSVETTAKKLNRSIPSVKGKARKLGLNNYYGEKISAKTLAKCFHLDIRVVIRWIDKFDLPCKKVELDNQTRYSIDPVEFWKWAEKHKDTINWSKYELKSLVPEPEWVNEIVSNYTTVRHGQKFTPDELARIKFLICRGKTYSDIAREMQRSYYSISHVGRRIFM